MSNLLTIFFLTNSSDFRVNHIYTEHFQCLSDLNRFWNMTRYRSIKRTHLSYMKYMNINCLLVHCSFVRKSLHIFESRNSKISAAVMIEPILRWKKIWWATFEMNWCRWEIGIYNRVFKNSHNLVQICRSAFVTNSSEASFGIVKVQ